LFEKLASVYQDAAEQDGDGEEVGVVAGVAFLGVIETLRVEQNEGSAGVAEEVASPDPDTLGCVTAGFNWLSLVQSYRFPLIAKVLQLLYIFIQTHSQESSWAGRLLVG
jgi:hypothetical protein